MNLLVLVAVAVGVFFGIFAKLCNNRTETGRGVNAEFDAPENRRRNSDTDPYFNPQAGEWQDCDGTPYGAIEDLLMDTDGDGIWDDSFGDGYADDWV